MTQRKPPGTDFESWVDKQIREAAERGQFDGLRGAGRPLPGLGAPNDENWWIRGYLRREGLSTEELLPAPLRLRKEIERLPDTVRELPTEQAVRDTVEALNVRIVDWLRNPSGPQVRIRRVDPGHVVERWREDRRADAARPVPEEVAAPHVPPSRRPSWWRRLTRRRHRDGQSATG